MRNSSGNHDLSATAEIVKSKIKKLIEGEETEEPLTDDEIVKLLIVERIRMTHRAVAKYRSQMQIPDSRERKTVVKNG